MVMNPEFKRNLWQELSVQRLIAMPVILLAIFWVTYLQSKQMDSLIPVAFNLLLLLLLVWGSGLAADAIFQEIREHTWDAQRMTPLGPWSMTWGKIFGSTIFVWYGAFWCLIAILVGAYSKSELTASNLLIELSCYLLIGIFAQSFGLFTALLFQRISPLSSRARVVLIQLFAIGVGGSLFIFGAEPFIKLIKLDFWYGLDIDPRKFAIGSLLFFCVSLFFGIYRLLRNELQIRSLPWAWPLFLMLWILYVVGFFYSSAAPFPGLYLHMIWFGLAFGIAVVSTFLAAFFTPKNIVHYYRLIQYIKERRILIALSITPPWIFSLGIAFILLLAYLFALNRPDFSDPSIVSMFNGFSISLFFFLLRDIGILYYITFNFQAKRAHLASIVYLLVLYTLVPMLLSLTGFSYYLIPIFAPWAWFLEPEIVTNGQILFISFLLLIEVLIAWGLALSRWRAATKQLA